MKYLLLASLLSMMWLDRAQAGSRIYVCIDAAGGVRYTDIGSFDGCGSLSLPGIAGQVAAGSQAQVQPDSESGEIDMQQQRSLQQALRRERNKLAQLEEAYNDGEPERQGNERNYAIYQQRVAAMRDQIAAAARRVESLQRALQATQ